MATPPQRPAPLCLPPPPVSSGKYTLIEVDYGADDKPAPDVKLDDKPGNPPDPREPVRPRIDPRVASLVSLVCDVSLMEASMKEIGFDAERMPLGKLKRSTILQGEHTRPAEHPTPRCLPRVAHSLHLPPPNL